MITASYTQLITGLLAVVVGCQTSESPERPAQSAFTRDAPLAYSEADPIGPSTALTLTRPKFTGTEIAEIAHSMAEVVADTTLPATDTISPERMEAFETAAAAVDGRVWLTIETGEETLEFDFYPEHPSIRVGVINRAQPHFTEPGIYPGIGRDAALDRARRCADLLAQSNVIPAQSYVRDPTLERAPASSYPVGENLAERIEVTDHYHFIFGQAPNGILLGNSELTIDVDAHSGDCFRVEAAFISYRTEGPVNLIVSVGQARAAVESDVPATGGRKVVDEGRLVYWLDPGASSAVVEPRYVSSYTIVSESGLASHGVTFAATLSQRPPIVTEF